MDRKINEDLASQPICPVKDPRGRWLDGWWRNFNDQCIRCVRSCKQSGKAQMVHCPQFEADLHKEKAQENVAVPEDIGDQAEADKTKTKMATDSEASIDKQVLIKKANEILMDPKRPGDPNSVQFRVRLIRCLEKTLRIQFASTKELKGKVGKYLKGYDARRRPISERIKRARRKKKWTQKQMAEQLGYKSHVPIVQFEKGLRNPSRRVLGWLEKEGM